MILIKVIVSNYNNDLIVNGKTFHNKVSNFNTSKLYELSGFTIFQ